jgi:hypothetical protein
MDSLKDLNGLFYLSVRQAFFLTAPRNMFVARSREIFPCTSFDGRISGLTPPEVLLFFFFVIPGSELHWSYGARIKGICLGAKWVHVPFSSSVS